MRQIKLNKQAVEEVYKNVIWTDKPRNFLGLGLNFTRFILTDKRLIIRTGILNIKEDEIELHKIVRKKVEYSLIQRIFGCGTVIMHTEDNNISTTTLKSIKEARKIAELLDVEINNIKERRGGLSDDINKNRLDIL